MSAIITGPDVGSQVTIDPVSKAMRVTPYSKLGSEVAPHSKATYAASGVISSPPLSGDFITIYGSATKVVRVISIYMSTTTAAASSGLWQVAKRSTTHTGGVFVSATMVPLDSNDPAATATSVGNWTTAPTAGTLVGFISHIFAASPVAVPGSFAGIVEDAGREFLPWGGQNVIDKPITLRGTSEGLGVGNWSGAASTHTFRIVWIEE